MTKHEALVILTEFQKYRLGKTDTCTLNPKQLTIAINYAIKELKK